MLTGGGVQRAARPDFILKRTVRIFFLFFSAVPATAAADLRS